MATTDLATLVRVSKLTSKDLLADSLEEFVKNAKTTAALDIPHAERAISRACNSDRAIVQHHQTSYR